MGLTISSQNYKLVHVYTEPTQNYCIPSTPIDYFINDNLYFIFNNNTVSSNNWLLFKGKLSDIMDLPCLNYIINEDLLLQKSINFINFYELVNYIDNLDNKCLRESIISFQKKNINTNYFDTII